MASLLRAAPALAATAAGLLALSGCGGDARSASEPAQTVTVTDSRGEQQVPTDPERVLVYDMGVLDTVEALGAGDAVVGVAKGAIPDYLAEYESEEYANVGDLFEPDLEAIPATEPDLIIVGGRSSAMYDTLADAFEDTAVIDISVDESNYLDSVEDNVAALATIFGAEDRAEEILTGYQERIAAVRERAEGAGDALVLLTSAGEVTAYSTGSRFAFVHDVFGLEPATGELGDKETRHGEAVSFEFLRETDPDRAFVVDRDAAIGETGQSAEQILDNDLVAATTAWQEGNVTYVDPTAWYIVVGGLTALDTVITEVEQSLE